jgi:beta-phosphoglucomutase-like phosphatase (HAD superfamily)
MKPQLVIFDKDGVLVDNEPIANHRLSGYLTQLGLPFTLEASYEYFPPLPFDRPQPGTPRSPGPV